VQTVSGEDLQFEMSPLILGGPDDLVLFMSNARLDCATEEQCRCWYISNESGGPLEKFSVVATARHRERGAAKKTFALTSDETRTLLRISQDELAARSGLHPRTIARLKRAN